MINELNRLVFLCYQLFCKKCFNTYGQKKSHIFVFPIIKLVR
jgi:hypothetical protein